MNYHTNQLGSVELFRRALVVGLGAQLIAAPALFAQATSGTAPTEMKKQVVTGSLIPTAETVTAAPVDIITPESIQRSGARTIDEVLRKTPTAIGGGNYGLSQGNGGDGTSAIALRGIPGGTLVLVNGRRTANQDLNAIPFGAVDRIEVLKDGGSSLYGADAVAGVVNIILKKDFNGAEFDASYGNTTSTDAAEQRYSFILGSSTEKTSVLIGGTYYRANSLYSRDRDRSLPDLSDPNNTSGTSNPGRVRTSAGSDPADIIPGGGLVYRGAPGTTGKSLADYTAYNGSTDRFPFPLYTPAIRDSERYSIFGNAEHALFGEHLKFFTDAFYTKSYSYNQLAPTPIVFANQSTLTSPNGIVIPANNPFNPFGIPITTMAYRPVELGPRVDSNDYDIFRFTGGFKGQIGDSSWGWETATLYTTQNGVNLQGNDISRTGLEAAINSTNPATAFNPFGNAANSQAVLDAIRLDHYTFAKDRLFSIDGKVFGELFDLPGGPVQLVVGAEHREETRDYRPDGSLINGDVVGFNSAKPYVGSRDVNGVFYEIKIPILGNDFNFPGGNYFELNHSGRYEDYSDFGTEYTPKIGFLWQPLADKSVALRGSYSESFTAPAFSDLYTPSAESFPELINPVRRDLIKKGVITENDYPVLEQVDTFYTGNPNLKPATAKNLTASIVYTPPALKTVTFGVDWFRLEQSNVAGSVDQFIIDENYRTGGPTDPTALYSNLINYDPATYTYNTLTAPTLNLSKRIVEGFDGSVSYVLATDTAGTFTSTTVFSYFYRFDQENIPGSGIRDRLGDFSQPEAGFGLGSLPRIKGNTSLFWAYRNFEVGPTLNYIGAYLDDVVAGFDREVKAQVTLDFQASYKFTSGWLDKTKLTAGVLNVTDERPPLVEGSFADKYDRDTHDLRGRFWYVQASKKF